LVVLKATGQGKLTKEADSKQSVGGIEDLAA
jgi:hypothetical protein